MNADMINTVFQMARVGLSEVAKNPQNGPAAVAQAASVLEAWRAEMEKLLKEPQPTDAKP